MSSFDGLSPFQARLLTQSCRAARQLGWFSAGVTFRYPFAFFYTVIHRCFGLAAKCSFIPFDALKSNSLPQSVNFSAILFRVYSIAYSRSTLSSAAPFPEYVPVLVG